jgi:tetratricopeptide (TPR) repeat protein
VKSRRTPLFGVLVLLSGCVYYNSIYNAEQSYGEAEAHRRAGRDSLAAARYQDVIRKAADGYRRDPVGEWAADALFLLGKARLRLGETHAAEAALESAFAVAHDSESELAILVFRGVAAARAGNPEAALSFANRGLGGLTRGPALAEGHLLRGRLLLADGQTDAGWWDLDRAGQIDGRLRMEASFERLKWAVFYDERGRAQEAVTRLMTSPEAGTRLDSLVVLTTTAAARWGPAAVAAMLSGADSAAWGRTERARIRVARAVLLDEAGDAAGAETTARDVARGIGEGAAEARLWLARSRLARSRDLSELDAVRSILLPEGEQPQIQTLLIAIGEVDRLVDLGLDEPLAFFAAAEVARDELVAPMLARGFFLAFASAQPQQPWAAKALLAAIGVSPDEGDRAWLRGRLEVHRDSPYVLAARGDAAPGFEALEEDLALRLREVRIR